MIGALILWFKVGSLGRQCGAQEARSMAPREPPKAEECAQSATSQTQTAQRSQYPLMKEYTLNYIGAFILWIFLYYGVLGSLGLSVSDGIILAKTARRPRSVEATPPLRLRVTAQRCALAERSASSGH